MPWCSSGSSIDSSVLSCPPCMVCVDVNTAAGLSTSAPCSHRLEVWSRKCFSGAAMLPKRVGLPRTRPSQCRAGRRAWPRARRRRAPCVTGRSLSALTGGTLRRRAAGACARIPRRGRPGAPAARWCHCASSRRPGSRRWRCSPARRCTESAEVVGAIPACASSGCTTWSGYSRRPTLPL